jgi:aminoglycoside phosphotransferase
MFVSEDVRPIPPRLLERVAASAAGISTVDRLAAEVERLRTREQSTVLEYRFEGGLRLIAKRYARRRDALASYEVLRILRKRGFGSESPYRVAEPLGCFADWGVLVMRAVPGQHLRTLTAQPAPWEEGLRAAAGWLAQLHALSVDLGPPEDIPEGLLRVARKAARAGAHHPELEGLLARLIEELAERARSVAGSRSQATTHGRYHAGHVFVAPDSVAVVDLDRVALADPAKDVGEFLHRLRAKAMRAGLDHDAAERATLAFLEEYAIHAHAIPGGLVYYWSQSILCTLLRVVELSHSNWEQRLEFYRAEFEEVPVRAGSFSALVA